MCVPSFMFRKKIFAEIWGQKGSKMGVFGNFSKLSLTIWFHLLEKKDIICLHVCAKFHVQEKNIPQDMGSKGVKKGGFR